MNSIASCNGPPASVRVKLLVRIQIGPDLSYHGHHREVSHHSRWTGVRILWDSMTMIVRALPYSPTRIGSALLSAASCALVFGAALFADRVTKISRSTATRVAMFCAGWQSCQSMLHDRRKSEGRRLTLAQNVRMKVSPGVSNSAVGVLHKSSTLLRAAWSPFTRALPCIEHACSVGRRHCIAMGIWSRSMRVCVLNGDARAISSY